jgi:transcriptional regulator GlxA family with amidase domain
MFIKMIADATSKTLQERSPSRRAVCIARWRLDHATFEHHYSVEQLAERWNMSRDFVRRRFLREEGVVIFMNR